MTDRPKQEPMECKHFDCWKCRVHHGKHPCMFASVFAEVLTLNCPYFASKKKSTEG